MSRWTIIVCCWWLYCPGKYCLRHQMKTFSASLALCAGNSPVAGEFPSHRPVARSLNCWVNNREAGDLRYHCAHYDVTVVVCCGRPHYHKELLSSSVLRAWFIVIYCGRSYSLAVCPWYMATVVFISTDKGDVFIPAGFVSLSVSNFIENRWTNFHEIFRIDTTQQKEPRECK